MKILLVLYELRPSGAEMMIKSAAPLWIGSGCELHVLAMADSVGEFASEMRNAGCVIHHLPVRRGCGIFSWLWKYFRFVGLLKPDIVHVQAEKLSAFTVTIPRLLGVRTFRSILNNFPYSGKLRFQKSIERAWQRFCNCRQISICTSIQLNEKAKLFNPTKLCWAWFNDVHFRPPTPGERADARINLGLTDKQIALVSVGNGNDVKNYSAIIEALAILLERDRITEARIQRGDGKPDHSLSADPSAFSSSLIYLMVGNEHAKKIERTTAERLKVSDFVRFCGPENDIDKYRRYLWAADLYLMPSKYEGFSIAAIEGLSCGLPCIFADSPGLGDLKEFPLDIVWSGTDPESIAVRIAEKVQSGGLGNRNLASAEVARSEFGVGRRAQPYLDLWNGKNVVS